MEYAPVAGLSYLCTMLQTITITDLYDGGKAVCLSEDFFLIDDVRHMPGVNAPFRTQMLLFFFCMRGHMRITVGEAGRTHVLSAGDIFVSQPGQPLTSLLSDKGCETWVVGYMPRVVDYLLPTKQDTWSMMHQAFACPVLHYGDEAMHRHLAVLLDMVRRRADHRRLRFCEQQQVHLFASILFEVVNQAISRGGTITLETPRLSRTDSLFREFVNMLTADEGRHRTVAHYADSLCITPKHLSAIIRRKTGKKALAVINEHAIELIKLDLKLTDTPIGQLAGKYNFTNFSFFCQFVKTHLGKTPQEYRAG